MPAPYPIRSSLRRKLALAMLVTSIVPLLFATIIWLQVTLSRLERDLRDRANQTSRIGLNLVLRYVQQSASATKKLASNAELLELLTLQPALLPKYIQHSSEDYLPAMIEVSDLAGNIVARVAKRKHEKLFSQKGSVALERALDYEYFVTIYQKKGHLVIQSSAPAFDSEFILRGAVVMTLPLDDQIADLLKSALNAEIAFGSFTKIVGSTFHSSGERFYDKGQLLINDRAGQIQAIDNKEFYLAALPLQSVGGDPVGRLIVGIDRSNFQRARASATRAFSFGFGVALLITLFVAAFVGRMITRPLARLHRGILSMASGDRQHELNIETADEIGAVANAFTQMSNALQEHENRLAARIRELSILHQVGQAISSKLRIDDVLKLIVDELTEVLEAQKGAVLFQDLKDVFWPRSSVGLFEYEGPPAMPTHWKALAKSCIEKKHVIFEGRTIAAPLLSQQSVLGVLVLARNEQKKLFSDNEVRLVMTFAGQVAAALKNAELYEEVRRFSEGLELEVEKRTYELRATNHELEHTLSELKETQSQLVLSDRLAGLGSLVAGVAHEINTPSGAIRGASQVLSDSMDRVILAGAKISAACRDGEILFQYLVKEAKLAAQKPLLSAAHVRKRAKSLAAELDKKGIKNSKRISRRLVAIGVEHVVDRVIEIEEFNLDAIVVLLEDLCFVQRSVSSILLANERIVRIVKALRAYSHADQEAIAEIDITEGIETTLTILQHQMEHGIQIKRDYQTLPKVTVYVDELNQVWTNLIYNAVQAMEGNGIITISTFPDGSDIGVRIADNGPGIAKDVLPRIFEPHFSTKKRGEGTGLGLGIALKIVQKHGGQIAVETRKGYTSFTVLLPQSGPPLRTTQ